MHLFALKLPFAYVTQLAFAYVTLCFRLCLKIYNSDVTKITAVHEERKLLQSANHLIFLQGLELVANL